MLVIKANLSPNDTAFGDEHPFKWNTLQENLEDGCLGVALMPSPQYRQHVKAVLTTWAWEMESPITTAL